MISLIKADLYKEVRKKSFKFIVLLIMFVSVLSLIVINKNIKLEITPIETYSLFSRDEYKNVNKYGSYEQYVTKYQNYKDEVSLKNKVISENNNTKLKYLLGYSHNFVYLIGVIVIFLSFHSFSYDYQKESLKYVFMTKNNRKKVYFSKLISLLLITLFLLLVLVFTMLITASLLTYENIFSLKEVVGINNLVKEVPYLCYYFKNILVFIFPLMFMIVFSMFLSILFKGSNFGLIISGVIYFSSLMFSQILFKYGFNFIEYTFLPYLDFTYFADSISVLVNNMIYNLSLDYDSAIFMLVIYGLVFMWLSIKLLKRDV